jgi:hypothetical protein
MRLCVSQDFHHCDNIPEKGIEEKGLFWLMVFFRGFSPWFFGPFLLDLWQGSST